MTMETIIFASLCVGAAAGLRLRVFVLFPLIFLGLIATTVWGLAHDCSGWSILEMNVVGSTCLQLGYLVGLMPSFLFVVVRQSRRDSPPAVRPFTL
jgi:hypothetical protein